MDQLKTMNREKKIEFPKGIPGFEEEKEFMLREEEDALFARLTSCQNSEVSFVLIQSRLICSDYLPQVDLAEEEAELLEMQAGDRLDVWSVLTLNLSDISQSTVNLRAPLLINSKTNKGLQIILNDESYSFRRQLFAASAADSENREQGREGAVD